MDQKTNGNVVSLVPATLSDVPALADIQASAFKTDQFSNLLTLNRDENIHKDLLGKKIEEWMLDSNCQLVKAIDVQGNAIGWSCWVLRDPDSGKLNSEPGASSEPIDGLDTTTKPGDTEKDATGEDPTLRGEQAKADRAAPTENQQKMMEDPARALGKLVLEDAIRRENQHMKGRKYVVLHALFTDPGCQGQGVGSKLIQSGIDRLQADGLECWVHATPAGHSVYKRAGFQDVGRSDYDLDEWAPGGKGGNRGWGRYTFRYMLRPAN